MNRIIQKSLLALSFIGIPVANAYWKPAAGLKWNWDLKDNPNNLSLYVFHT